MNAILFALYCFFFIDLVSLNIMVACKTVLTAPPYKAAIASLKYNIVRKVICNFLCNNVLL